MVFAEHLDPTSLKWQNFLVAETEGIIVGIGQVRMHRGCRELGSLVVLKGYRGHGIAGRIVAELERTSGYPMYLLCESKMEGYYTGHGYRVIGWRAAPTVLKMKLLPTFLFRLFGIRVLIMGKSSAE
jgi:N-acetylglutamate synthase-like GNAT family acetyltransferase